MSREQARAGALERLQRASAAHRKQLHAVDQLEVDDVLTKEEAEAERTRIGEEKIAAKVCCIWCILLPPCHLSPKRPCLRRPLSLAAPRHALATSHTNPTHARAHHTLAQAAYQASLVRIEAGDFEEERLVSVDERPPSSKKSAKRPRLAKPEKIETLHRSPDGPPVSQAQGQALRDLRVQQLQKRVDEANRALKAATAGDPELVAFEQRLEQLAAEEKKKGPTKHFSSLTWRKACVAMVEIFHFGARKASRKMAKLLDEEGAASSMERQFASLKNWRRAFAAGKLGTRASLLQDDIVDCSSQRRAVRIVCPQGARKPGPRRMFSELERKLKDWVLDCQQKDKTLTRAIVCEEALRQEPNMFGGRASEDFALKMSRWYYKFLRREKLSIRERKREQQPPAATAAAAADRACILRGQDREENVCLEPLEHHAAVVMHQLAAKRVKRVSPRYSEEQLRKLEAFFLMGRDRLDFEHVAQEITSLDGGRVVTRETVAQWFANRVKRQANSEVGPGAHHWKAWGVHM
jgi:hypothetical protein